jgi:isopentenyl diphosphate isomerase/L-lactate dehydrogenase-like FMN-dependent dehydrogenase
MTLFPTVQDMVWSAKQRLPAELWDYVTHGAESETTLRRNRQALDSLAFRPRIMRDVTQVDPSGDFLGERLRIPVILAPVGSIALMHPAGAVAAATVAERFGIRHILSGYATPGLREVARVVRQKPIFALHPHPGMAPLEDIVDNIVDCGGTAVTLVAEAVFYSRRERDLMSQVRTAYTPQPPYSLLLERARAGEDVGDALAGGRMDWSMIGRIKQRSSLKVILKGVTSAADAQLAVGHGVDVIYVSNHGGRALDHALATIQSLPAVVAAVAGRVPVIVDGGFCRGSDVLKAIALGASAVAMGKMQAWALAAGGEAALQRLLELLEEEIVIAMALLGVNGLAELSPDFVEPVVPVAPAHPMSAFPVLMERIAIEASKRSSG